MRLPRPRSSSEANAMLHYILIDHLGNVRATLKRGGTATAVDVTQRDKLLPIWKVEGCRRWK
ncbi:hypothetical protein [Sphingobacterium faecium]|uniref:hypothetical protein n=1 Tax=Sphingobacterium faecium TaxID=34087 RepID=UPI0024691279|nr:hypothetical protein [Sphingobacterium faecium]MDH5826433.1 hypothetical protein [Sphingobacterium faecium]